MNKAEFAVVITCPHSIKDSTFDLDAERSPFRFDDLKLFLETPTIDRNTRITHINSPLPLNDVSRHHSVDSSDLVADARSSMRGRRIVADSRDERTVGSRSAMRMQ